MEQEEEMKNNEINKINQVYSSLVNNKNCFLDKYCRTYDGYLKFLKSKINNEKQNLEDLIDKQYNLQYEVNQLLSETIKKQEKLTFRVDKVNGCSKGTGLHITKDFKRLFEHASRDYRLDARAGGARNPYNYPGAAAPAACTT